MSTFSDPHIALAPKMNTSKDSSLAMKQLHAVHQLGTRLRRVNRCENMSFDWRFSSIRSVSDTHKPRLLWVWLAGTLFHVVHFCFCISRVRSADRCFEWETYSGDSDNSSISWVRVLDISIIAILIELTLIFPRLSMGRSSLFVPRLRRLGLSPHATKYAI